MFSKIISFVALVAVVTAAPTTIPPPVYNNAVAALKTLESYGGVANQVPMLKAALNAAPSGLGKVPSLDLPNDVRDVKKLMQVPKLEMPKDVKKLMQMPKLEMPKAVEMPKLTLADMQMPNMAMPKLEMPAQMSMPNMVMPVLEFPTDIPLPDMM